MIEAWADFCVAQIGASAALAGLVFVGASINLAKIIEYPRLVGLVLEAILMLSIVLGEASILLAPHHSLAWAGGEIIIFSVVLWIGVGIVQRRVFCQTAPEYRHTTGGSSPPVIWRWPRSAPPDFVHSRGSQRA